MTLAESLTLAKLRELWIIPIVFVLTTAVSMIVAYIFGTIMRLKRSQRYVCTRKRHYFGCVI